MNQKNSLGLNNCFLDIDDPIQLFKIWMDEAIKTEPNDPNAVALATSNESFSKPEWVLEEVSEDKRYFNSNLSIKPFCEW